MKVKKKIKSKKKKQEQEKTKIKEKGNLKRKRKRKTGLISGNRNEEKLKKVAEKGILKKGPTLSPCKSKCLLLFVLYRFYSLWLETLADDMLLTAACILASCRAAAW